MIYLKDALQELPREVPFGRPPLVVHLLDPLPQLLPLGDGVAFQARISEYLLSIKVRLKALSYLGQT